MPQYSSVATSCSICVLLNSDVIRQLGICCCSHVLLQTPPAKPVVRVCSLSTRSLYHSLSNVYYPLLGIHQQQNGAAIKKQQRTIDPKLEELLLHVQAGLGKLLRGADATQVCVHEAGCYSSSASSEAAASVELLLQLILLHAYSCMTCNKTHVLCRLLTRLVVACMRF